MINTRILRLLYDKTISGPLVRRLHPDFSQPKLKESPNEKEEKQRIGSIKSNINSQKEDLSGALSQKYKIFRDEESTQILDIYEERERYQSQDVLEETKYDIYAGINLKRGLTGVFDIEELVDVLRKENVEDIFVASVPKELKYIDFLVVCSGRSYRHMLATAEFVRRVYKMKREKGDILPRIEGEKSRDWMALDLGNIALHIFSPDARESYDLESLWAIGTEYDTESNKPEDPLVELFKKHTALLADVKPQK